MPSDIELEGAQWSSAVDLQKYLLRKIEESQNGAPQKWEKLNLEHLAPQNPSSGDDYWYQAVAPRDPDEDSERSYDNFCKSWGNVTLLEEKLNKSIQNAAWPLKLTGSASKFGISKSGLLINSELKTSEAWTREHIEVRGAWMLECAQILTGSKWVQSGKSSLPPLALP